MKIVHVASEYNPLAKVGGLGDVVGGLTLALSKEGSDVEVFLPKYKNLKTEQLKNLKLIEKNFKIFEKGVWHSNKIYSAIFNKVKFFLIEDDQNYFDRAIYGYKDDVLRFLYFSKTALDYLKQRNTKIDILHLHDWPTSFIAPIYKEIYSKENPIINSIVLSIHSMQYQGLCQVQDLNNLDIDGNYFFKEDRLKDPVNPNDLNLLKGGIVYSDFVIPVSENYAKEILTKKYSENLLSTIEKHKKKIKGLINGIDEEFWNPSSDKFIFQKYSADDAAQPLVEAKKSNRKHLQELLNLEKNDYPLICSVGRLVPQKGPELLKHAILQMKNKKVQFVLLGTFFDEPTRKMFFDLKDNLKNNRNISLNFEFNEKLSHIIFSAADFIVIPSLFEPCGLTQMIGFRYGTIPIVRKTGGLADTVFDLNDSTIPEEKRNGFSFDEFSAKEFVSAINRALKFKEEHNSEFNLLVQKNMKLDFSWGKTAKQYLEIYKMLNQTKNFFK
ncbi:MAG: glycogen/starch synthase [Parachlamydiales bacterium]|jgi:starch synthase